jgi:hypothetical protein
MIVPMAPDIASEDGEDQGAPAGAMSDLSPLCAQKRTFVSQPLRLAGNSSTAVSQPGAAIAYFSISFLRDGPTGLHRPETTG